MAVKGFILLHCRFCFKQLGVSNRHLLDTTTTNLSHSCFLTTKSFLTMYVFCILLISRTVVSIPSIFIFLHYIWNACLDEFHFVVLWIFIDTFVLFSLSLMNMSTVHFVFSLLLMNACILYIPCTFCTFTVASLFGHNFLRKNINRHRCFYNRMCDICRFHTLYWKPIYICWWLFNVHATMFNVTDAANLENSWRPDYAIFVFRCCEICAWCTVVNCVNLHRFLFYFFVSLRTMGLAIISNSSYC